MMKKNDVIYVAGHRGLAGTAIVRALEKNGFRNIVTRTHSELDLTDEQQVADFFDNRRPDHVFLAAAKVGGIGANNTFPAEFIYQNLVIATHVVHHSWRVGVKRLLFLGSSCIYPKHAPQPMCENHLMTGPLEPTNEPYAVAKIAGIQMCWAYNRQYGTRFIPVMPTNLYGPGDNFDLETAHVLPAMIRKFHLAKLAMAGEDDAIARDQARFGPIPEDVKKALALDMPTKDRQASVVLWGTGSPRREFLCSDDLADACLFVMQTPYEQLLEAAPEGHRILLNVGAGRDSTLKEMANIISTVVECPAKIHWDTNRPDGTPQKLLDVSRLDRLGWHAGIELKDGIRRAYQWYCDQIAPAVEK